MGRSQPIVFVLWSHHFEEAPAVIFVSELRQAGLCVKVVSLQGRPMAGIHGLALVSDMTLGQALPLAGKASCVVMPCTTRQVTQLRSDPRLTDFFQQTAANHALFVIGQDQTGIDDATQHALTAWGQVIRYPTVETLVLFVRELVNELAQR